MRPTRRVPQLTFCWRLRPFFLATAILLLFLLTRSMSFAGSATWDLNPGSGDWNTNANWTPATGYPGATGITDVATFGLSNTTSVGVSLNATIGQIVFNSGASAFTITVNAVATLTLDGTGITNNSGITQKFVTAGGVGFNVAAMVFNNSATAGANTSFVNNGGTANGTGGGATQFNNSSTAGSGAFTNNGGAVSGAGGGSAVFSGSATAGSGTFTNNGGAVSGASGGFTQFFGSSTAGSGTFINNGVTVSGGAVGNTVFSSTSMAGSGTFTNNGAAVSGAFGGLTDFIGTSNTIFPTAGSGTFTNNGGTVSGAFGGLTRFRVSSTAGGGTFTNNGGTVVGAFGGSTQFANTSTAGSATLIANGGTGAGGSIFFFDDSIGGTASVDVRNNGTGTAGNLDISAHNAPGVTIGSLEGSGNVFLGANNLTVGSNNLSKTFSGVIQDGGGFGGTGGSLTKIGSGTLSLTNSNTFTGGTLINAGTLIAAHDGALGRGNVSLTASSVTLTLQSGATNNYINDSATLTIALNATVNLNYTGTDVVAGLIVNGVSQAPGIYGSSNFSEFMGTGTITVVPEPTTLAMMALGAGLLVGVQRFRHQRS